MTVDEIKLQTRCLIEQMCQKMVLFQTNKDTIEMTNFILNSFTTFISSNKFFKNDNESLGNRDFYKKKMYSSLNTTEDVFFELIDSQMLNPFGVFYPILVLDIPDIIITNNCIRFQYSKNKFWQFEIPSQIQKTYKMFFEHMIQVHICINETKFDIANPVKDLTYGVFRINLTHKILQQYDSDVVVIRKHIANLDDKKDVEIETYKKSLGVDEKTLKKIEDYAFDKSFIVIGDTGSGKTTFMRYLINSNIKNKRNVITIEDEFELFIKTNLAFRTSEKMTIHDLFVLALRQNPSHLYIGETRTDTIIDILEAGLTFPVGTSIHAVSLSKAFERIYWMSEQRQREHSKQDIFDLISASADMLIFMKDRQINEVWIRNDKISGDVNKAAGNIYDLYERIC